MHAMPKESLDGHVEESGAYDSIKTTSIESHGGMVPLDDVAVQYR